MKSSSLPGRSRPYLNNSPTFPLAPLVDLNDGAACLYNACLRARFCKDGKIESDFSQKKKENFSFIEMVIQVVVQVSRRPQGFMPQASLEYKKSSQSFLSVILLEILPCSFYDNDSFSLGQLSYYIMRGISFIFVCMLSFFEECHQYFIAVRSM